jgi:dolichol-phosphate mannosyltransferase
MTESKPYLYMVVPIFNELGNLPRLFTSFSTVSADYGDRFQVQFVVVDDGSSDGSGPRASELANSHNLEFVLLTLKVNRGPGGAFATAFRYLSTRLSEQDWVVTLEGDNTSRHELLKLMFHRASEGYDVVLASPYMYGGGITNTSSMRVFLSHMANAFVKEFLGIHGILTVSSFFRLYRAPTLMKLQIAYGPAIVERRGFECMVELLMKMMYLRTSISEIPMLLDTNLRVGKTKMKITKTILGYLSLCPRRGSWKARVDAKHHP